MALAASLFSQLYGFYPVTANSLKFSLTCDLMERLPSRLSRNLLTVPDHRRVRAAVMLKKPELPPADWGSRLGLPIYPFIQLNFFQAKFKKSAVILFFNYRTVLTFIQKFVSFAAK